MLHVLVDIALLWLAGNALHALWIGVRRRRWERGVRRDVAGILEGAQPYTVGRGAVAVLWVHGFADTPQLFRRMAERLAATGNFTCRVMRLPGAAEPLAAAGRQNAESWLAAVRVEASALRRDHAQVWLAGHSLGGALALTTVLRAPTAADGLILLAPLIEVSRRRSPLLAPRTWFQLARAAFVGTRVFESCFAANVVASDDSSFVYLRDRFIPFATYRGLFALCDGLAGRAADVRVPVFAALAGEDRVVDTPAAQRWLSGIATRKEVVELQAAGHTLPLECGWQALTDRIAAFVGDEAGTPHSRDPHAMVSQGDSVFGVRDYLRRI